MADTIQTSTAQTSTALTSTALTSTILTSTAGQTGLPRYFAAVFQTLQTMRRGRLDIRLPDGRVFRVEGAEPGHLAEIVIHDPDVFARLIREGDLGFSEAYIDGGWSTPDLLAFMDLVHDEAEQVYDGFPGQSVVRLYEKLRFWLQANTKRQAQEEHLVPLRSGQRVLPRCGSTRR